jgi:polar amino acid transport system substrate-binding protein
MDVRTRGRSSWLRLLGLIGLTSLAACGVPRDPEGTLEQARAGTLRVGAVDSPPHLARTAEGAGGPEAELVRAFARSIGAEVDWQWGALDDHLEVLKRFELDLVAAGLTARSPWKREVAFSRPWNRERPPERVLAVPPGENAMLFALDRFIEAHAGRELPGRAP